MALTNDDRLFITQLFDIKLEPIKKDIDELKERVASLEERVASLEERIGSLEERVGSLEERVGSLEYRVSSLENSMSSLRDDVNYLKFQNENEILPRLQNIEACYVSTCERYIDKAGKIDEIEQDVSVLKTVAAEHSRILKNIS